jgi:two-component system OmpR family response regulator
MFVQDSSISILIVDDDQRIRDLLTTRLQSNYFCTTSGTVAEARRLLNCGFFNVLIADIALPDASGLDLCETVRSTSPDTVVVMISGLPDMQYVAKAMRMGALCFLAKPFNTSQISRLVECALSSQRLQKPAATGQLHSTLH